MDTDPPRHSRSNVEAPTIDLAAQEVKDAANSEAEGTDEEPTASTETETVDNSGDTAGENAAAADPHPEPARASGQSGVALFAAALIGGVVVLGGAAGLQYWGVLPSLNADTRLSDSVNLLSGEVETLKKSVTELRAAKPEVDFGPVNEKIAAIETRLADVPQPNGLSADADARLSVLSGEVSGLKSSLDGLTKSEEEARAALIMRLEALEKQASEPRDDVEVAVAIASAGLKAAIDRGGSFASELDTLAGIAPDNPAIAELKPFAAAGVPSRASLDADFPAAADRILSGVSTSDPDQSMTDRLLTSALSAIKIRPVGDVEGDGPAAVVARIEQHLNNGDLKAAAAEWEKLPEAGKAAASDYKASLDARIRVEELVGAALSKAVQSTETKG